jgi:general secretion pathway protein G
VLKNVIKKEGGFTLLELLIVIVIIGILALLIIPNITSAPKKARDTQRKTDLKAIQKGLEEYFISNNAYPVSASASLADTALAAALESGSPAILKPVPKDPKNVSPWQYGYQSAAGTDFTLTSCLENTADQGADTAAGSSALLGSCTGRSFLLKSSN